ncbi:porin [Halomonas sp. WWR20]
MKKTLLATAIAGALGASAAAQAATVYNQDGTQLDIYGNIQIAYRSVETAQDDGSVESADDVFDNGSTIGVSGQHIINPGLTGYFKAEWEHNADEEKTSGGINRGDQSYLGLQGNFGDVRLGSWDALIDDWVEDPISNNEYFDVSDSPLRSDDGINTQNSVDREGDKLQYLSPSFNGLQFAVGTQYKGDAEEENVDSSGNASFYGGAKYAVGAFSVAAVYDNLDNYDGEITGNTVDATGEDFDAGDQYGVTFQYTMNTLRVALKYERYESDSAYADENRYALGARYGYGYGDVYGAYQYVDVGGSSFGDTIREGTDSIGDNDDSNNEIVLGATYNISPAMYTFIEGAWYDQDSDVGDGVAVGAVYAF